MRVAFLASNKDREHALAEAFCRGVNKSGDHAEWFETGPAEIDLTGFDAVAMVGVKSREAFHANRKAGRHVFMLDKGYSRHRRAGGRVWEYWRVAVDAHHPTNWVGVARQPEDRLRMLGLEYAPWRKRGRHVLIAGSSAKYHAFYGLSDPTTYATQITQAIEHITDRPIIYRPKPSWKDAIPVLGASWSGKGENLAEVLRSAWVMVTHGSNACFEAVLAGVPCIVIGNGVARPISSTGIGSIEDPRLATDGARRQWLANLAYCQWTEEEFASGEAWATIRRQTVRA